MTGESVELSAEQEQHLLQQLFNKIIPLLPQHVKDHIKPVIRELVMEEDSVFDTTAHSPSSFNTAMLDTTNPKSSTASAMDKLTMRVNSLETDLREKDGIISELKAENNNLQKVVFKTEGRVDSCETELDNQNAHNRLNTVQLGGIPNQGTERHPEDCYEIVKHFCDYYLHLTVYRYDIDICHRQFNPAEKWKQGRKYIPSIYVKFTNRFMAREVLKRRNRLRGYRNKLGGKFTIEQNLSPKRRILWDSIEAKLPNCASKWIRNGSIYVKKDKKSRPIKVNSEQVLD